MFKTVFLKLQLHATLAKSAVNWERVSLSLIVEVLVGTQVVNVSKE